MTTSWTCDDSINSNGDCMLIFDLFSYRHIKQVKIGKMAAVCTLMLLIQLELKYE